MLEHMFESVKHRNRSRRRNYHGCEQRSGTRGGPMADEPAIAQPGFPLGPASARRLRLGPATHVTHGTDPSLPEPYRARFEGAPPKVRERGGVVTVEYGPRFRPTGWGGQAADITLHPSAGWRI